MEDKKVISPSIAHKTMSFPEAIMQVAMGRKIHKLEWKDKEYFGMLVEGELRLHKPDNKLYQWILSEGDINGNDWIVLTELN